MNETAVLVCALDTKGKEAEYVKVLIEEAGLQVIVLDTGILGEPYIRPDISREEIAVLGGNDLAHLTKLQDRGLAVETMMRGAAAKVSELYMKGQIAGIIGLGGSAGTTVATGAMRELPLGIPKVMATTLASGNTRPYVGLKDITMVNTVVDISGLNSISRTMLAHAAFALIGMMKGNVPTSAIDKPLVAASMFGVTTPCVDRARAFLEEAGYEVIVFHGTGAGGEAMENLIASGFFAGVLDITTSELADDVAGGLLSAGPTRLTSAGLRGIPQVVSVGAVDMANFGPVDTVPDALRTRKLHQHNPNVTLMRTNAKENTMLGELIADKLNRHPHRTAVFLPLRGVSSLDTEGFPFYGPEENAALFTALRMKLNRDIELIEMNNHINDEEFALAMARKLLEMMRNHKGGNNLAIHQGTNS